MMTCKTEFVLKLLITLLILLSGTGTETKIMRNNALINKMVTNFHRENDISEPENENPKTNMPILTRMQNVLCKNFPSIPSELIMQDRTLKKLIEKSIEQINHKKLSLERSTAFPAYLTLFPIINNEDLSYVKPVLETQPKYPHEKEIIRNPKKKKIISKIKEKSHDKQRTIKNKSKMTSFHNRKKLRKFYPHKVKYRDKVHQTVKEDFADNSGEKLSMSVEVPDMTLTKKHQHFSYKMEPEDPPVWRIDYMKHGEPSLNMFGYENDKFNSKIMKTGPNVVVDNIVDGRKDVLHPDVYIKNNFVRKNVESDDVE